MTRRETSSLKPEKFVDSICVAELEKGGFINLLYGEWSVAELGHAHCQHLHAVALLYSAHGIDRDINAGMDYLVKSAQAKFAGSLDLLAEFYEKGEFGLPIDRQKAASLHAEALENDAIGY